MVFDWDGTLSDSVGAIVGCAQEALAAAGLTGRDEDIRQTIGLGLDVSVPRWSPGISEADQARVLAAYRSRWIGHWSATGGLFEFAPTLLAALAEDGHLLAIATGKSRAGLVRDLDKAERVGTPVRRMFAGSRTVDEAPAKPAPGMLIELMDELGARRETTIMVGDTTHDLEMARAAGCVSVGVLSGAMESEELAPLADEVLPDAAGLLQWLARR